jgi:hypothetical protein
MCPAGRADCLVFALEGSCPLEDSVLDAAVTNGHLKCVELLVAKGLPNKPYLLAPTNDRVTLSGEPLGARQLRCLEHLFDKGCPVHPGTLISAAARGDFAAVRFLHSRGVLLWAQAWEDTADDIRSARVWGFEWNPGRRGHCLKHMVLTIPPLPKISTDMWKVLGYGSAYGAPVTPVMEEGAAKRRSTRALLLSFHVAARLSRVERTRDNTPASGMCRGEETQNNTAAAGTRQPGEATRDKGAGSSACRREGTQNKRIALGTCGREGSRAQRAGWASMGCVPIEVIEKITVLAGFEVSESLHRGFGPVCCLPCEDRPRPRNTWVLPPDASESALGVLETRFQAAKPHPQRVFHGGWWKYDGGPYDIR